MSLSLPICIFIFYNSTKLSKILFFSATEFSLISLLAQHLGQVMTYDELLDEIWKDEEDAIYNRVSFHISKIRRTILKTI